MADSNDEKLTWKKVSEIARKQADELMPVYSYPNKDVAVPAGLYEQDMSVIVLGANKKSFVLPLHESSDKLPPGFEWAKESFTRLTQEWDKIADGEEKGLLDNFRQRKGVLCLQEGLASCTKLWNTVNQTDIPIHGHANGSYNPLSENKLDMDHILSLSDKRDTTTLIHELTHGADKPRANQDWVSQSSLFGMCLLLDRWRGSRLIGKLDGDMKTLISEGAYTKDNMKEELICRLNERRHADPERFKKECPLLDSFFGKVFYPALDAQTVARDPNEKIGSPEAYDRLHDKNLLKDQMKGLFSQTVSDKIFDGYLALDKVKDMAQKIHLQQKQADFIDSLPAVQRLHKIMSDFSVEMKGLKDKIFSSHIVEIPKMTPRYIGGLSSRLSENQEKCEQPMDKHNGLDYRNVGGKDRKSDIPKPDRPTGPSQDEIRKKAEEIRRNLGWHNEVAAKHGHSL